MSPHIRRGMEGDAPRQAVRVVASWATLVAFWLLLTGSFALNELVVGAIAVGIATFANRTVRRCEPRRLRLEVRALAGVLPLPWHVVRDTFVLARVLGRRILGRPHRGALRVIPFDAPGTDARSTARRALAVLIISTPPNRYVVAIDRRRGRLLVHELAKEAS